jgi:hypothetical protein
VCSVRYLQIAEDVNEKTIFFRYVYYNMKSKYGFVRANRCG